MEISYSDKRRSSFELLREKSSRVFINYSKGHDEGRDKGKPASTIFI